LTEYERREKDRFQWSSETAGKPEKAVVLVTAIQSGRNPGGEGSGKAQPARSDESRLSEACGLAEAISLQVVSSGVVPLKKIRPATLFGAGKTEEIAGIVKLQDAGLVIVDHTLSPVQQRNLEKAWNCKVLDRTGLILEIFGARARTKEGRLQVELAHLTYQKGRLVRQWTHLERQRGGLGKTAGPGETQIEADRRLLQERILRLEKELEKVKRTRGLHRQKRKKVPTPVVALVGYTNAGKSTLFNRLTNASVTAKDMLFATLDPTLREVRLPSGTKIILSDTVGFISDLPTMLVAAFRATLEEVVEADLILHVRDIADADNAAQAADVYEVLDQIGLRPDMREHIIEVWNKTDLLSPSASAAIGEKRKGEGGGPIPVSALTGEGLDDLLARIDEKIGDRERIMDIRLTLDQLGVLSWIYANAQVIERRDQEDGSVSMRIRVRPGTSGSFKRFAA
jgi:GTPase